MQQMGWVWSSSPHRQWGEKEEAWHRQTACMRNGGPRRAPINWVLEEPSPLSQACCSQSSCVGCPCGFWSILGGSGLCSQFAGPLWLLRLQWRQGTFKGLRRWLVLLPSCAVWACHSPGIITGASQSHREAPWGQGYHPTLGPHTLLLGWDAPQMGDLGVLQRGWGHDCRPLWGGGLSLQLTARSPRCTPCSKGACVSQTTARPVTCEWSQEREGQETGGAPSRWTERHWKGRTDRVGKTDLLQRRTTERESKA